MILLELLLQMDLESAKKQVVICKWHGLQCSVFPSQDKNHITPEQPFGLFHLPPEHPLISSLWNETDLRTLHQWMNWINCNMRLLPFLDFCVDIPKHGKC